LGNRRIAETHFLTALQILQETHANPAEFFKVYNGLMHVHLDLTFSKELKIEELEEHLQTAMKYNNEAYKVAQQCRGETGYLAQVKLQKAVLNAREVQVRGKHGRIAGMDTLLQSRDRAVVLIEQALGEMRDSSYESKEKSIKWGKEWQDRLGRLRTEEQL